MSKLTQDLTVKIRNPCHAILVQFPVVHINEVPLYMALHSSRNQCFGASAPYDSSSGEMKSCPGSSTSEKLGKLFAALHYLLVAQVLKEHLKEKVNQWCINNFVQGGVKQLLKNFRAGGVKLYLGVLYSRSLSIVAKFMLLFQCSLGNFSRHSGRVSWS